MTHDAMENKKRRKEQTQSQASGDGKGRSRKTQGKVTLQSLRIAGAERYDNNFNRRYARGTMSIESVHSHLVGFIPGTSANGIHFLGYLLEGIYTWNHLHFLSVAEVKHTIYSVTVMSPLFLAT